jgi:uncharacterized RDD family membrane protein YckC
MADEKGNIYAPTEVRLDDVRASGDLELASRSSRLGAVIVDSLIIGVPLWTALFVVMDDPFGLTGRVSSGFAAELFRSFIFAVLAFALYSAINWIPLDRSGQTWGKKLMSVRIVRADGSPVGAKRALFMRYLPIQAASTVPFIGLIFALINSLMIFRESRQCLHDNIADTIVVKA